MVARWQLAIDFGTSFTTGAMLIDGKPEVLEIENSRYLPSMVFRGEDGALLTGQGAVNSAEVSPERAVRVPKRELVERDMVLLDGSEVDTAEVVAALLSRVLKEALRHAGGMGPERVLLTHPARWGEPETARLRRAARLAGLPEPVELVPEPVAAALCYTDGRGRPGQQIAVYDLGGGTFDTTVLRRTATGFEIVATGGDPHLGGEDFDEAVAALFRDHARETKDGRDWLALMAADSRMGRQAQSMLRHEARKAKEWLSQALSYTHTTGVRITRAEFEAAITEQVKGTVNGLNETIGSVGLSPGQLAAVYLAGGSSRVPLVNDMLAEALGFLPSVEGDPKCVVAIGALRAQPGWQRESRARQGVQWQRLGAIRGQPSRPGGSSAVPMAARLLWTAAVLIPVIMGLSIFGVVSKFYPSLFGTPDYAGPLEPRLLVALLPSGIVGLALAGIGVVVNVKKRNSRGARG